MFMCHRRDLYYINITQFGQPCDLLTPQLRGVSYIGLWTLLSSSQSFAVIQFTPTLPAPDSSGSRDWLGVYSGQLLEMFHHYIVEGGSASLRHPTSRSSCTTRTTTFAKPACCML